MNKEQWLRKYGPWALVTGASNGIGREIARDIARRGLHVVLVSRSKETLEALGRELTQDFGVQTRVFAHDLADRRAREQLLDATKDMDIGLVVPAAGFGYAGLFAGSDLDRHRSMLALNCEAVLDIVHGYTRRLIHRGRGAFILWSSITAFAGVPNSAHYAATKAWNQSFAEGLHIELKKHGIDVLASAPAMVNTGFADEAGLQDGGATPREVARATMRALGRKMTVRPGFLAGFLDLALKLPRSLRARIMGSVMGGMAKEP